MVRMRVPTRELTPDDLELVDFARQIVDAHTDGETGVHTMGAAVRGIDGSGGSADGNEAGQQRLWATPSGAGTGSEALAHARCPHLLSS
jgi:hypothetical protein